MEKFQDKYRIQSARLQNHNYSSAGIYFVTICTVNREHFFGKIIDSEMRLSKIGRVAKTEWFKTLKIRPDMNLQMDTFVVMPNHIHGIIIIGSNKYNDDIDSRDAMHRVSTTLPSKNLNHYKNSFAPQSKNLSSIIRGYKSSVTKQAHKINIDFNWQPRFYDHIIRNNKSLEQIQNYIINNPQDWKNDKFNCLNPNCNTIE